MSILRKLQKMLKVDLNLDWSLKEYRMITKRLKLQFLRGFIQLCRISTDGKYYVKQVNLKSTQSYSENVCGSSKSLLLHHFIVWSYGTIMYLKEIKQWTNWCTYPSRRSNSLELVDIQRMLVEPCYQKRKLNAKLCIVDIYTMTVSEVDWQICRTSAYLYRARSRFAQTHHQLLRVFVIGACARTW